eukprot:COSAG01_NODE_184_length_22692_cov_155.762758_11_plen_95_part_00
MAGEEPTDAFAGKSAEDVEQQIVQMLGAAAVDEGVPPGDMVPADQRRTLETPEQAVARLQKELAAKDEQHERELAAKDEELAMLRASQSVAQAS